MKFICPKPNCVISTSKAVFPEIKNCPVCQTLLIAELDINELSIEESDLISSLPYVIAYPLKRAITENHAGTKINLLKDTFLNYLKYLGLVTASEFFQSPLKDKRMVALFHATLAEPSFGTWNQYIRETIAYLQQNNHIFFCPELPLYYDAIETGKKRKLYKGEIEFIDGNGDIQLKKQEATAIGMLINFRNRYLGHGLTLDASTSEKLWEEYYPIFKDLLLQMTFCKDYPMLKTEYGETFRLQSDQLQPCENPNAKQSQVWMENEEGKTMDILPFFVVPGEVAIGKEDKEQILTYESYTGKTIKFFSPEGTEKQTSGKILERLNMLLRDKQKEQPSTPDNFTREVFLNRINDENKLILSTLTAEKKYIPGVYVHREEMEIKLREWIGARANIFFIAAEAGSGKTNLLLEIQNQYTQQNLPVLFIRAARMEKQGIWEQLAYLLNIQTELGIESYPALSGTQASPIFILIDGLNEAHNAEQLWNEIIQLSQKTMPGSVKFVVTSRANTAADLNRYVYTDAEENYLYGDKKEGHTGLSAYAFWLTPLNMAEMKGAWDNYVKKDKNKYKPQFSFDALATFDRALYSQISNPLVLRIFLETYHNKPLSKKGNRHLNIWHDWLASFSENEIRLMELLAQVVWEKGENELLLDDLLNDAVLKPYLTTDLINAPYPRLKNLGWISRYVKDLNACVSFTVEGALLYLMGAALLKPAANTNLESITKVLTNGTKIQKDAIAICLCQQALNGKLEWVSQLIDSGVEYHDACNTALLLYLRHYGVEALIDNVFLNATNNDWFALRLLNNTLEDLEEQILRKQLLEALMPMNPLHIKPALELGLKACSVIDQARAREFFTRCEMAVEQIDEDADVINNCGVVCHTFAQYDKALEWFQKCLDICLKTLGAEHPYVATLYYNIGNVCYSKDDYDKALEWYQKCLDIGLKTLGAEHPSVATSYNNGLVCNHKGDYDKALEWYQKCLDIELKTLGEEHPSVASLYNNIGNVIKKWIKNLNT